MPRSMLYITMPSRRAFLCTASIAGGCAISGCTALGSEPTDVDILIRNNQPVEHSLSIVVSEGSDEVFRTETTAPASGPSGGLADAPPISAAFEGNDGDQFTVEVALDGQSPETFDYEITCADEELADQFAVYILDPQDEQREARVQVLQNHCAD